MHWKKLKFDEISVEKNSFAYNQAVVIKKNYYNTIGVGKIGKISDILMD